MEKGPKWPGEMGQITARPLWAVDLGFWAKLPSFPFSFPLSRAKKGLPSVPPRLEPMPTAGYGCSVQAARAAVVPRLSREPASGSLNLLKRCLYIPFEQENALQHVLHTERSRPTRRA